MTAPAAVSTAAHPDHVSDHAPVHDPDHAAALPPTPPPVPPQPIARLLTVVITTSPTPSAPSTELLEAVLASFRAHAPPLLRCPVVVVLDAFDRVGPRPRLKRGSVSAQQAGHYDAYKTNVRRLVERYWWGAEGDEDAAAPPPPPPPPPEYAVETDLAEFGSPFGEDNAVSFTVARAGGDDEGRPALAFVEPAAQLGFGLAVRTAVRAATTPYVWIQQHDWTLEADVPLAAMLDVMRSSEQAVAGEAESAVEQRYCPPSTAADSADGPVPAAIDPTRPVPVRYICLPSVRMLGYAASAQVTAYPALRALTQALQRSVPTASSLSSTAQTSPAVAPSSSSSSSSPSPPSRLPLTPLFLWHDKPHLASAAHYLARVFPSRLAVGRGDFLEDHIGQRARDQMKHNPAAWRRFACWLYYPDNGRRLCVRHLMGRTWRGEASEQAFLARCRTQQAEAAAAAAAKAAATAATTTTAEVAERPATEAEEKEDADVTLASFSPMTL